MTAPIWMALPPEVHSALLSDGPGPGSLLAAAAAWNSLSAEYTTAAEDVGAVIAAVGSHTWEGSAAESWVAAHVPYVMWLLAAAADSAAAAAQHEVAAAAYAAALATMPTLAELAVNRTGHIALVATNFFGMNTIPIAVNESDYLRMWIQAAAAMTGYQASAAAALASTPQPVAAPPILRSPAASLDPGRALLNAFRPFLNSLGIDPLIRNPLVSNTVTELIADMLEYFGVYWDPGAGILNGLGYEEYADATQPMWYLARGLELIGDTMQMSQNPAQALQYFVALSVFDWPTHIIQLGTAITQSPLLFAAVGGAMLVPATAGGVAGLAGLAGLQHPVAAAATAPVTAPPSWPTAGMGSSATSFASVPASAPAPSAAPTAAPVPSGAAPPAPPTAATGFYPPYVVAPPGIGFGSGMSSRASASARSRASEPDSAAASATSPAQARRQARARARQRTTQRHYGDEFMDLDVDVNLPDDRSPDDGPDASDRGAGYLGRTGAAPAMADAAVAAGLTTLMGDEFGGGPTAPMVPSTWP